MERKNFMKLVLLAPLAAAVMLLVACNGGNGKKDADAGDDAVDVVDGAEDVAEDDAQQEPEPDGEEDPVPDPVEEDVAEEDLPEEGGDAQDIVEEELPPVPCPIDEAGTASLGGYLNRGTNMLMDSADEAMDAVGNILVAIFDSDPRTQEIPVPVASTVLADADLSSEANMVEFCVQNIPVGDYWFAALLDDDGSAPTEPAAEFGDIVTMPPLTGTLAADESITDAHHVLNVRIGRVSGNVTIDADFAATQEDLTGDLYMGVVDQISGSPAMLGYSVYEDVTLSPDASVPYEVLLMLEPTSTELGIVVAIFDVDESGVTGMPENGDLVNFDVSVPIIPPTFTYDITGVDESADTEIITVFSL